MSKRFFPQHYGGNKKAKLDISESDHNFPQSQYISNENNDEIWGDDIDEDILLQASEAIENISNRNISFLPDYSQCMHPASTSTQYFPAPCTSREDSPFKKPPAKVSLSLKQKCDRIASTNIITRNVSNDSTLHDRVYKEQDSDSLYQQLLQIQKENEKLKLENGKLVEKCLTKEGEVSILRTQMRSSQAAVDKARIEKLKAEEKAQIELNEKMAVANKQIQDLKLQLDFQNVEIMNTKEKCKLLESNKVKLTQLVNSDALPMSSSIRHMKSTQHIMQSKLRAVKENSDAVKTVNKSRFLKLNKIILTESRSKLNDILPLILEPTAEQQNILDYSEELQKQTDAIKCTVYSTFHRLLFTPCTIREVKTVVGMNDIHEDVTLMATRTEVGHENFSHMLTIVRLALKEVCSELETILVRMARTAFRKEMTERYLETICTFMDMNDRQLISGKALYKEEQAILARRMVAILAIVLETPRNLELFINVEKNENDGQFFCLINKICSLIDDTFTGILYSGLLHSILILLNNVLRNSKEASNATVTETLKCIGRSRASPLVVCHTVRVGCCLAETRSLCDTDSHAKLRLDEHGLFVFKKDSCFVSVLSKQVENTLRCIEKNKLVSRALDLTRDLIELCYSTSAENPLTEANRNGCLLTLLQVIVFALRICAVMLKALTQSVSSKGKESSVARKLERLVWGGARCLHGMAIRDADLQDYEGHLLLVLEIMDPFARSEEDKYVLSELSNGLQCFGEERPAPYLESALCDSINNFHLFD